MASGLEKEMRLEDEEVGVYRRRKRMKAVKKRRICDSSDEADSIKEKGKERAEEKDCGRRQGWHVEEGIIVIHSSEDVGQKRRSVGKKHRKRRRSAGEKSDKKEVERDKRRKREDIFQKEESGEDSGRKDRERRGPGVIEKRHYKKDEEEEDEEMVHCRRKKKVVVERWRIIDSSDHVIEKMESIKAGARKRKKTTAGEDVGVERKYHRKRDKAREDEERPGGSGVQKAGPGETASIYIQRLSFHHQLGKGSFGKVLLAEDCLTGLQLAVKIMRKRDLLQEERELVLVERRVLQIASGSAFLTHGYLAFQTKNHLVLGLEYASGGDFHQFLRRKGCLNITSATFYAAEITCGVEYLHSKGIIHRDLKPENILVAGSGHLKIADYGLAIDNIFGDQTATEYAGTPGYIAPEMLAGEEYNAGVDWFSFGVILNRMITGTIHYNHRLFHKSGAVAKNIIKKLLCEDPPRRLGVNGNIRQHRFFQHIDWVSLEALRVTPPCVPVPPTITPPSRRFDFEKMEAAEDQIRPIRAEEQDVFRGFSFISAKCRAFPRTPLI